MFLNRKFLGSLVIGLLLVIISYIYQPVLSQDAISSEAIFEEVWQTVKENFYDPSFKGLDWQGKREEYKTKIANTKTIKERGVVINQLLSELKASHTRYYTPEETEYYQLAGIFWQWIQPELKPFLGEGKLEYRGIGIYTRQVEGKTFIRAVLDGSPGAKAGLKVGHEIISVDGKPFEAIDSFQTPEEVKLLVQTTKDLKDRKTIKVKPEKLKPETMFLDAMKASTEVINKGGKKIAYIHVWSYAGEKYQDLLEQQLLDPLKDADALIWDLRDGWGGAIPTYLNIFTAPVPRVTMIDGKGERRDTDYQWKKPVVLLINEGSRSGKEMLAYAFRKYQVGKIVGSKTQGAVLGGRAYVMKDGTLLYLAVVDVIFDGVRLEGKGIEPDVEVNLPLEYSQGVDLQKEKALEVALEAIFTKSEATK